jgi:carbamoyl-phosphate synthase / aspartate carbamoyltransferase
LSKAKSLKVTCDVSIYALFFNSDEFSGSMYLPSTEDQDVLWKNLDVVDAFSIGGLPFMFALEQKKKASSWSGVLEALPLLLSAVADGRLTLDDIQKRLHDNPIRIFGLSDKVHTHVEVVMGRKVTYQNKADCWSPIQGKVLKGAVHRVLIHEQTAFLDGIVVVPPMGRDLSSVVIPHIPAERAMSTSGGIRPDLGISALNVRVKDGPVPGKASLTPGTGVSGLLEIHHPAFHRRHILSVKQFSRHDIHDLFSLAHEMQLQVERSGTLDILKGKVLATIFYEPSTRTSASFDAAMKRCGGSVIQVSADTSSVMKGESLPDTIRTLGCYADAIVIRHPDVGSSQLAAKFSPVPVLNAGDGIGEHPTQVSSMTTLRAVLSHICI